MLALPVPEVPAEMAVVVKARIWKDRETGRWFLDVQDRGVRSTGSSATWHGALAAALDDMRWIEEHQQAWPEDLAALGWRP